MTVHAGYDPIGDRCLGTTQPGTIALRTACLERWPSLGDLGIYNCRNVRGGTTRSAHAEGRAWDAGCTNEAAGRAIQQALVALNDKLGLQVVIFWDQIWSQTKGWHAYTGADNHHGHLHIEQNWSGAHDLTYADAHRVLDQGDDLTPEQEAKLNGIAGQVDDIHKLFEQHYLERILDAVQQHAANPSTGGGTGGIDRDQLRTELANLTLTLKS